MSGIFDLFRRRPTANVARERLQILLAHERASVGHLAPAGKDIGATRLSGKVARNRCGKGCVPTSAARRMS